MKVSLACIMGMIFYNFLQLFSHNCLKCRLSAGILRQATYTTTRLGVYNILLDHFSSDGTPPNFFAKAALGKFLFFNYWINFN